VANLRNDPQRRSAATLPHRQGADLSTAAAVLEQISSWIEDYNAVAPHSALGFKSPREYRGEQQAEQELAQMS
jgi:transposase InsO family protein